VTHEQTVVSGLSNRLIAHLASRIAVSYEESLAHFPRRKTVLTGNPVRPEVLEDRSQKFNFQTKLPVLYVTAGNQGSHVINEAVQQILPQLLERYVLIHQVGAAGFYDDYGSLGQSAERLPTRLQERYHLERYIGPQDIGSVLRRADLVIGRSGANTVSDLAATKVPALFIPLPFATHDEQTRNARLLVNAGSAEILPQRELTPERLLAVTEMMIENLRRYKKAATEAKQLVRPDAAKRLASEVIALAR
jgi:UDP-N-acetylglucosamine--N-acetylmuramyl-(pentapeptide) pyrophosphoryl-undecaprenol N-acetylglucosamine transferase